MGGVDGLKSKHAQSLSLRQAYQVRLPVLHHHPPLIAALVSLLAVPIVVWLAARYTALKEGN